MRIFIFAGGQNKEPSEGPIPPSCRETDPPSYHVPASPLHRYRTYKAQCCGSGRFIPDPNFFHPGSASKNLRILTQKLFPSSRKYDRGCSFLIRILIFYPSRIQCQKGIGSRIRIRNTDKASGCLNAHRQ